MLFPFASAPDDSLSLLVGAAILRGWSLTNQSDAAGAQVTVNDSNGADVVEVAFIDLLPSESTREWFTGNGILLRTGAQVLVQSENVRGTLYLTPISNADDVSFAFGQDGPFFVHEGV